MSIYNEDELIAPDWINQEFVEKVLRQYEKSEEIKVCFNKNNNSK